jgi:CheY-like chemotaxis protein
MSNVPSHPPRVLVVEDDELIAECLHQTLEDAGACVVGPFGSVPEVLDLLTTGGPAIDLALLDVNIRGESCFPVADALQARRIPFVFMTGYSESAIPECYRQVPRLEKPIPHDEILRVVGVACAP